MRVVLAALAVLVLAPAADAGGPAMRVGAAEDEVRQTSLVEAKAKLGLLRLAGLDSVRVSSTWAPGQSAPAAAELVPLDNVVAGAGLDAMRVYISVANYGSKTTPLSNEDQQAFADYTASIAKRYPTLAGIIVGNEPNLNRFWLPQFNADGSDAAAPAYETLLAKTYDAVKAVRPSLHVIGGAVSPRGGDDPTSTRLTHSPTTFIRDLGLAYRATGRTTPIMDAFGFHPYGDNSSQPPTFTHPNTTTIGLADYGKLVTLLGTAFDGTAQAGSTLPILYDEYGVETTIPADKAKLYTGTEPSTTKPVDAATQGKYYAEALALAFCQPNVEGLLLFHAFDETSLAAWQSGIYYADGTPKPSLPVVRTAAEQVRRGIIAHCDGLALTPKLTFLNWPRVSQLRLRHMSALIMCDIDCRFDARVAKQRVVGTAVGGIKKTIAFPKALAKGVYRIRLVLTAPVNPGPVLARTSPLLRIP
ncbi:MAG: polysaccharide biosynthesis protein PslG [Gaiellaceae bacterium]|nr:polysaccharide biosynthesis protein PslG [Gaiellaceae bacterium]